MEAVTPEDAVYIRAARLLAVQHAVAEICGGRKVDADPQALKDAVLQIRAALKGVKGAHGVFIGGLAVQHLGYERWTDDVDVVVDAEHYREVLSRLRSMGFELKVDFKLENKDTGAKVDLMKEGAKLKDSQFPLPHPSELGPNRGFATLAGLVRLKLDTRRSQDVGDIVAILKTRVAEIDIVRKSIPDTLLAKFDQCAAEARDQAAGPQY